MPNNKSSASEDAVGRYEEPCKNHVHYKNSEQWKEDIHYRKGKWGERKLFVFDPANCFVWDKPLIHINSHPLIM